MIATVALLVYAGVLSVFGARMMRGVSWTERAPRLRIGMWQAATVSMLAAVALAGLTLVVPVVRSSRGLSGLIDACQAVLLSHYGGVAQPVGAYAGAGGFAGVVVWTSAHIAVGLISTGRQRRAHAEMIMMIGRHRPDLDVLVLDHAQRWRTACRGGTAASSSPPVLWRGWTTPRSPRSSPMSGRIWRASTTWR